MCQFLFFYINIVFLPNYTFIVFANDVSSAAISGFPNTFINNSASTPSGTVIVLLPSSCAFICNFRVPDPNVDAAIEDTALPDGEEAGQLLPAEIGLMYCNKLFYLERTLKDLKPEERKQQRLELEQPVWEQFWNWLDTLHPSGGSKLGKAVAYAQNHHDTLMNYLLDGRCEISNNRAERKAKSYAIGRKAFLFHTSEAGAGASAVMYSIVETAKANNLNIFQYLYTVLLYMPDYMNSSAGIEQLMPWSDFIKEQCSGLIDVESNVPEKRIPLPLA